MGLICPRILECTYSIGLLFPIIQTLSTKRSLIDEARLSPAKRHAVFFKLANRSWCLPTHIMDRVLIP